MNIPFGEKEEGTREKSGFNDAKKETGQEGPVEIVRNPSHAASDHSDLSGQRQKTNATHLMTPQTIMHAGR